MSREKDTSGEGGDEFSANDALEKKQALPT